VRNSTRALVLLGSLALLLVYVLPLWRIDLQAPQYPEGLGLRIRVSSIEGMRPHDLQNINGLNHYIGMKPIEPESIRELRLMPFVVAGLIVIGLAAAALGRRWLLWLWAGLLVTAALAGLVDFYLWGHDYGHNLDPTAAIQVPGMTYQPPLVGSKQLLNMKAMSWPASGGWIALAVGALAVALAILEFRRPAARVLGVATLLLAALATACAAQPRPIAYGEDTCALCRMVVSDERYGTELVTRTGRVHTFDSIECLAAFYNDSIPHSDVASLWVTDYARPGSLLPADRAYYLHSAAMPSPMGAGLTAFGDSAAAAATVAERGGTLLPWPGLLRHVAQAWRPGAGHGAGHGARDAVGDGARHGDGRMPAMTDTTAAARDESGGP
jgi:copper chaperone NosL